MRKVFVGMLILVAMVAVSQADVIRNVTATASSEYDPDQKEFTVSWRSMEIDGTARRAAGWIQTVDIEGVPTDFYREGDGFYEQKGWHNNEAYDISYSNQGEMLGTMWLSDLGTTPASQWIEFDLTGDPNATALETIKVWNFNHSSPANDWDKLEAGVHFMDIELLDSGFNVISTSTPTTNIELDMAPGLADSDFGEVIDIANDYNGGTPVSGVAYVTFYIISNHGDEFGQVGLSEVKFYDSRNTVQAYAGLDKRAWLVDTGGVSDPNDFEVQVTLDEAAITGGTASPAPVPHWDWFSPIYLIDPNLPAPSFDPNVLNPTITFYAPGPYIFALDANDITAGVVGEDSVTVNVYAPDYTGLIAHWKFDEGSGISAADEFGNLNIQNGLGDTDGPVWVTPGVDGTGAAIDFLGKVDGGITQPSGNYDAITIHDVDTSGSGDYLISDLQELAITLWFKMDPETGADATNPQYATMGLIDKNAFKTYISGDRLYSSFLVTRKGPEYANTPSGFGERDLYENKGVTNINDGQWHFLVLTYDGFYANVYVDGVLDAQRITYPGQLSTGLLSGLMLGARNWSDAEAWVYDGLMDDVRLYEIYLDQAQVADLYEEVTGHAPCVAPLDGDLDGDCDVDLTDFSVLAQNWLL